MKRIYQGHLAVILLLTIGTLLVMGLSSAENSSAKEGSVYYTCPMAEHVDVVMDKPGKCPKCGMKLVEKKIATIKYVCPMKEDADVVMDKPGKCPKCGMKLVPKEMGRN